MLKNTRIERLARQVFSHFMWMLQQSICPVFQSIQVYYNRENNRYIGKWPVSERTDKFEEYLFSLKMYIKYLIWDLPVSFLYISLNENKNSLYVLKSTMGLIRWSYKSSVNEDSYVYLVLLISLNEALIDFWRLWLLSIIPITSHFFQYVKRTVRVSVFVWSPTSRIRAITPKPHGICSWNFTAGFNIFR